MLHLVICQAAVHSRAAIKQTLCQRSSLLIKKLDKSQFGFIQNTSFFWFRSEYNGGVCVEVLHNVF